MSTVVSIATESPTALGEITRILTFRGGYNTSIVIAGTSLLGLAAGVVGVFALLRRRSLTADALSHATLPGIAIAFLVAGVLGFERRTHGVLMIGAAVSGVLGVLTIQAILRHTRLRADAAIGIVLSVFFGVGVVLLSYIQNEQPSGAAGLNTFIFGQAATLRAVDVWLAGVIALIALGATGLLRKELTLVCFNDAFARTQGWPVGAIDVMLMALLVLVTVAGLQSVGLLLVIALLIIPAVTARLWTERVRRMMVLSGTLGAASGYAGATISALAPDRPAGAVIVLTAGSMFLFSLVVAPKRGVLASAARRLTLRVRVGRDHLLELAHDRGTSELSPDSVRSLSEKLGWGTLFRSVVLSHARFTGHLGRRAGNAIEVTERGRKRGAQVSRNHALWSQYLISYADVAPSHVDWSVDQVEHVLSDELVRELEGALAARSNEGRA